MQNDLKMGIHESLNRSERHNFKLQRFESQQRQQQQRQHQQLQ